jgi:hypothetical protein
MRSGAIIDLVSVVIWLACARETWLWAREARAAQRAARKDLERMRELKRQVDQVVADNNARIAEWIA